MLEVIDLAKRHGPVVALDGATFNAQPGRIVGFLGPNGAGKTTTMRCIFGLARPDRGEVRWAGKVIDKRSQRWKTRPSAQSCRSIHRTGSRPPDSGPSWAKVRTRVFGRSTGQSAIGARNAI